MKKFLLVVIILLICMSGIMVSLSDCFASTSIHSGKISGVINVYWPREGFKPGRARINILNTELFTVSSSYGNYVINNIPDGQHTVTVYKYGYLPAQKIINVVGGQKITDVDFNIEIKEPEGRLLGSVSYLGFNLDHQPFNNLKVRQALNYAIDKKALVDEINSKFNQMLEVAQSPLPPKMSAYNPNITGYLYNVDKAKDLLSQAGYPKGFNIDLYYPEESKQWGFIAKEVKKYLAQIGVKADLKTKKWSEFVKIIEQGKLPFFVLGWGADTPDPADYLYSLYHSKSSVNNSRYKNSTIDSQIEQAWGIMNEADFVQLIQQIEKTIVDDAPAIYISHMIYMINK